MPPQVGPYLISNAATNQYLGVAGDNTVMLVQSPKEAQVWTLFKLRDNLGYRFFTTLRDGTAAQTDFDYNNHVNSSYYLIVSPLGTITSYSHWSMFEFQRAGSDAWRICLASPWTSNFLQHEASSAGKVLLSVDMPSNDHVRTWIFHPLMHPGGMRFENMFSGHISGYFVVSSDRLKLITEEMISYFQSALGQIRSRPTYMIPTLVPEIPNGREKGSYLALAIADTYIRISDVKLLGNTRYELNQKEFSLSSSETTGTAADLFAYIALCIKQSVEAWRIPVTSNSPRSMGMTFPFPVDKTAIDQGRLIKWTKGFAASGAVGNDVVRLLQAALDHEKVHVVCNAFINDATATLLTRAYMSRYCHIGAIFGSGTNGAYVEKASNVCGLEGTTGNTILNTEWGNFEGSSLERTQFDYQVDRLSITPGSHIFEKLTAGMYIGEILRLVILYFVDLQPRYHGDRQLFNGKSSEKLNTPNSIDIMLMADVEDSDDARIILEKELGLTLSNITEEDAQLVKELCRAVVLRAARLSACAIAAIIILMGRADFGGKVEMSTQIGMEGDLAQKYPAFKEDIQQALREILGKQAQKKVSLQSVYNGSDIGAALIAYQVDQLD